MRTARLEAFSDGILAIVITVMVLELAIPEGNDLSSLFHHTGTGLLGSPPSSPVDTPLDRRCPRCTT